MRAFLPQSRSEGAVFGIPLEIPVGLKSPNHVAAPVAICQDGRLSTGAGTGRCDRCEITIWPSNKGRGLLLAGRRMAELEHFSGIEPPPRCRSYHEKTFS